MREFIALGSWLNSRIRTLRDFNIPEPVTSGLLVCVVTALLYSFIGLEISFSLATRDFLLLYFFASIGLNSDIKTLWAGGIPLLILVVVTIGFMLLQNLTGIAVAHPWGWTALSACSAAPFRCSEATAPASRGLRHLRKSTESPTRPRSVSPARRSAW
jgi:sodium--glutamate symport carrier gltS